jgi:DNA-binding ferritin-like protein (Dps family)
LPKAEFWEIFDTKLEEIQDVCSEILGLYNYGKIELKEVYDVLGKFDQNINVVEEKKEGKKSLER